MTRTPRLPAIAAVPSDDPSSTTMSSVVPGNDSSTLRTRAMVRSMPAASLKAGITSARSTAGRAWVDDAGAAPVSRPPSTARSRRVS
jgi:hypothetical protein